MFMHLDLVHTLLVEFGFVLLALVVVELLFWRWRTVALLALNLLLTALLAGLILFQAYSDRIATYESLALLGQVVDVRASVWALIRPYYLLIFADIFILGFMVIRGRNPFRAGRASTKSLARMGAVGLALCTYAFFFVPRVESTDSNLAAENRGLFMYQIDHAIERSTAAAVHIDIDDPAGLQERVDRLAGVEVAEAGQRRLFGAAEGRHLIGIQVESMQAFVVGLEVDGQPVTPNLDALIAEHGFYFPRVIQQVGQGNTSDCEVIANTSLYPLDSLALANEYSDRQLPGLPRLLSDTGYDTLTIHANEVEFWNRDELYPALGYDEYLDETDFDGGETVGLGFSDTELYKLGIETILDRSSDGSPVYASLITLTSHHPFVLPEQYQTLDLPVGIEGTLVGHYLQSMRYNDARIGEFVGQLDEAGLLENSVIAVYGDHFGLQADTLTAEDSAALASVLGKDYTIVERLTTPLVILAPQIGTGEVVGTTAGQVDIMPTLANLLGVDLGEQVHFGHDLLNTTGNLVGVRYYLESGTFADESVLLTPHNGINGASVFDLSTGQPTGAAANDYLEEYESILEIERLSDAYLEQLPLR